MDQEACKLDGFETTLRFVVLVINDDGLGYDISKMKQLAS